MAGGGPRPGAGRPKGSLNKTTTVLKEAILKAAEQAGGEEGLVGYLQVQARETPAAFMALLGKVLPLQVAGDEDNPVQHIVKIERVVVRPADRDA